MTSSGPPIQSWSLRSLPPLTWAIVLLAVIYVVTAIRGPAQVSLLGMLSGLGPFLFAATVTYMKPSDPRFLYGAVLIGVGRGLAVLVQLIVSQSVVVNELTSLLLQVAQAIDTPLFLAGVLLLGFGAGGIRTRLGFGIVALGVVLGLAKVAWSWTEALGPIAQDLPLFDLAEILATPLVYSIAWAFLVAAAFESRRRLLLLGSLVFIALDAVTLALTVANPGEAADFNRIELVLGIASLVGWLLLAVSPLRLEMGTQRPLRDLAETDATP